MPLVGPGLPLPEALASLGERGSELPAEIARQAPQAGTDLEPANEAAELGLCAGGWLSMMVLGGVLSTLTV